ncbi:MAG: hypothetical protein ABSE56_12215 [Bryobacteraceae bacterium]|jgi:hypothetical protein
MDIFAHGLWAAAAARGVNRKAPRRLRVPWVAFFGVFPDLFAFSVPVMLMLWLRLTGGVGALPGPRHMPFRDLAWQLYRISHSLIIFAAVFGIVWLLARRPVLELLGWPLHILIDIPTHSLRFFATPFLWPLSDYRFNGISWANRWFMLSNYTALVIVYILLWRTSRRSVEPRDVARPSGGAGMPRG